MQLQIVSEEPELLRIRVAGEITQLDFSFDSEPIQDLLGSEGYSRKVLLDMGESRMIDSRGVGWLLHCHRRFQEAGGDLVLHTIPPMVDNVLKVLKMQLVFKMASDEMAAERLALGAGQ